MFNWLAARSTGGKFILRIDDTDKARCHNDYESDIKRGLEWLGLEWDAEYRQSDRFSIYESYKNKLPSPIPPIEFLGWTDNVIGPIAVSDNDRKRIQTARIFREDGTPLYHFASTVDDFDLHVNTVIRGVDHLSNTCLHIAYHQLIAPDAPAPRYFHIGLIAGSNGKKMSKRNGDDAFLLKHYIEAGYCKESVFNCLLRLGWGPKIDDKSTSMISVLDALDMFLPKGKMSASPSRFDKAKLDSWDKRWKKLILAQSVIL